MDEDVIRLEALKGEVAKRKEDVKAIQAQLPPLRKAEEGACQRIACGAPRLHGLPTLFVHDSDKLLLLLLPPADANAKREATMERLAEIDARSFRKELEDAEALVQAKDVSDRATGIPAG